jgi:hypothetical protein
MKAPQHSPNGELIGYAFLSRQEISLFRQLIHGRRSLPVYRATGWACRECAFASTDLRAVARHIVRAHRAAPRKEDQGDKDNVYLAD